MRRDPLATRQKILRAADEVATTTGAGTMSLDAVAAHAGISKGGLLYHFPTKSALLQSLVSEHLEKIEKRLESSRDWSRPNGVINALLDHFEEEWRQNLPEGGLLAALADDPTILSPVGEYHRRFLIKLEKNSAAPECARMVYFALVGLRNSRLLGMYNPGDEMISSMMASFRNHVPLG